MKSSETFVPRLLGWLLRVFDIPMARRIIGRDPVLFAQWYSISYALLEWPPEVQNIVTAERGKTIELERLAIMSKNLGLQSKGFGADQTKMLMEGYLVHSWVDEHWSDFLELIAQSHDKYKDIFTSNVVTGEYGNRVQALCRVLKLTSVQSEILEFAFICAVGRDVSELMSTVSQRFHGHSNIWVTLFDRSADELAEALSREGNLFRSGVLETTGGSDIVRVHSYWSDSFVDAKTSLESSLIEPLKEKRNAGVMAVLAEPDLDLAVSILSGKKPSGKGVNLLLYGTSSLDNRRVLLDMLQRSNLQAWCLKMEDVPRSARRSAAYVAFCILSEYPERVLVIEKPSDILEMHNTSFLNKMFGIELEPVSSDEDEMFLTSFSTAGVWLLSDTTMLASDTIARFVFHAPLKKADRHQRKMQMEQLLITSKLGKKAQDKIIRLDGVSSLQIDSALSAAKLAGATRGKVRDEAVLQAIQRSQRALGRDLTEKFKASVTSYSTKFLNCAGRFGPDKIQEALQKTRRGTLVFYGPPGTGKTQFVEHLAGQLGIPLIAKRASDLMSKYVGDNEKNIANMFEEAASEDAMLLLDEGDSFLRDRSFARSQWEVTMVNELLQHMERFDGIFVVCTNLFSGLDAAALRRFTFKLEFTELDTDQRWEMFLNETGLSGDISKIDAKTKEEWWERLVLMSQLTAGDFATVQRQCKIMEMLLTPEEWLTQLDQEVKVKRKGPNGPMMD